MLSSELFNSGLHLMYYGMGVVFIFLTLLFVLTVGMSATVRRFLPDPLAVSQHSIRLDAEQISVITAAIHRYRNQHAIRRAAPHVSN